MLARHCCAAPITRRNPSINAWERESHYPEFWQPWAGICLFISAPTIRRCRLSEVNKDEKVAVARTEFNVAKVITSIAVLLLVLGVLKYLGMLPF